MYNAKNPWMASNSETHMKNSQPDQQQTQMEEISNIILPCRVLFWYN